MPRHVAFILPDIGGGGAERLTIDLMAGFLQRGARVDLVLLQKQGEFLPMVPPEVRIIDLQARRLRDAIAPLRRYYGEAAPQAVLAAMWPLTTVALVAAAGLPRRPRMAVSDHCPLRSQYAGQRLTLASLRASMLASYRMADAVVGVSDGVAQEIAALAGLDRARVTTIHNPVGIPRQSGIDANAQWGGASGRRILAVGKLKAEKNHRLLIEAFARLAERTGATLAIVGEGEERAALEALVDRLGLTGRVLLPGFTATPGDWYAGADLFVLSSDYEGFGNVLVEAMHCGLPVVSTDCPSGPAEVLGGGKWGALVPMGDAAALAEALAAALHSETDHEAQRARAAEFSVDRAVGAYAALMLT